MTIDASKVGIFSTLELIVLCYFRFLQGVTAMIAGKHNHCYCCFVIILCLFTLVNNKHVGQVRPPTTTKTEMKVKEPKERNETEPIK